MTADNIDGALDSTGVFGIDEDFSYSMTCQTCGGSGEAYAFRFSPRLTTCRECLGVGVVEVDQ